MTAALRVSVKSYGVKYRQPIVAQFTVDARILDNPNNVEELKLYNGLYPDVAEYVLVQPIAGELLTGATIIGLTHIDAALARKQPEVVLAVFCTGGKHRSVAMAEELARLLRRRRPAVELRTEHLDIRTGREQWPIPVEPPDLTGDDLLIEVDQAG
ncbi:MAG: RNase adapter protein RapZ [Pseudonocardiales bacterium]|jgi:UPF0042 nucleotide-binding protein|nr:RNase adapter protein RapZ [Pseudonocardiales bacterium]